MRDISKPLKTATVNRYKALLKAVVSRAYRQDIVLRNVAKQLVLSPENNFRDRVITGDEYPRLGAALEHAPFKVACLVKLLLATGLRVGEALNATFADVDRPNAVLHLALTKNGRSHKAPLSPVALAVIDKLEAARCNEFLFPSASGVGPMSRPGKAFKKILADAGITGLTLHDLRRTVATEAIRTPGVTVHDVSRLLNHSSVRVTEERYLVACNDRMLNASTHASSFIAARMSVIRPAAMLLRPTMRSVVMSRSRAFIVACAKQA
ncbi:MAG: site-specific integrase [Pseudomonadota bacterium]